MIHGLRSPNPPYFPRNPGEPCERRSVRHRTKFPARIGFSISSRVTGWLLTAVTAFLMLVQEISKATAPTKKPGRGTALYGRAALDSSAQQTRITRHLLELEQDNYHAIQIDIPKPESTSLIPISYVALYRCILQVRCVPCVCERE